MPVIQSSDVIGMIENGSDITQDVDDLVWWRDVENEDKFVFLSCQFLAIPELVQHLNVCLVLVKWGSPSIPLGRGDLHITHPELCD